MDKLPLCLVCYQLTVEVKEEMLYLKKKNSVNEMHCFVEVKGTRHSKKDNLIINLILQAYSV